jgi:hypothetical protein
MEVMQTYPPIPVRERRAGIPEQPAVVDRSILEALSKRLQHEEGFSQGAPWGLTGDV